MRVSVDYETLPGWCCSTEAARSFEELPPQAQNYVRFIEDFLQVPGGLKRALVLSTQTAVQLSVLLLKPPPPHTSCPFWFQWNGSESANPERAWSSCFDPPAELLVCVSLNLKCFTSKAVWTGSFCFRFPLIPQRTRLHRTHLQQLCINVLFKSIRDKENLHGW